MIYGLNLTPQTTSEITVDKIWNMMAKQGLKKRIMAGCEYLEKNTDPRKNLINTLKCFHTDHNWLIVSSFQSRNN